MAESVIGLYKTECVSHDGPFCGIDDLELATLSWLHWFHHDRLYSSIGWQTPIEHENEYSLKTGPRQQPLPENPPSVKPGAVQRAVRGADLASGRQVSVSRHVGRRLVVRRYVVGVLVVDSGRFSGDRLVAVPVAELLKDPDFRDAPP
jgi:integrase-like protein